MKRHRDLFSIQGMCSVLKVSRSGFYAWVKRPESRHEQDDKRYLELIKAKFKDSRETYGYRRIHNDIAELGERCGKNRVARLMNKNNIVPKTKRKFKVTTNSKHNKPIHNNLLGRNFYAYAPNERWTSDITYVQTVEGWLYLAVIMDLFSRKIIGWAMSSRMKESLVVDALKMALFKRKISSNLLLHSDRGSQYASDTVQQLLVNNNIKCSMSRSGDCWDNAVMESFFHSLKTECIYHEKYLTRDEARASIFDYIEIFYNRKRKHSFLGYQSPENYEILAKVS